MKRIAVYAVFAVAALLLIYTLRRALALAGVLLLVSATLAFLALPLCKRLERVMGGGTSALLAICALAAVVLGAAALLVPSLFAQAGDLMARLPDIAASAQAWLDEAMLRLSVAGVPRSLLDGVLERLNTQLPGLFTGLEGVIRSLGGFITALGQYLLTPIIAFYLLRDRRKCVDFMLRLTPAAARPAILRIGAAAQKELGRYVRGQLLITASTGVTTAIGLWIAGMPAFLVMGIIMCVFNLIPFVGPFIGAIPILMFAAADSMSMMLKALAVVLVSQQIESIFITPRVMSGVAHIHPVVVILLLLCAGASMGLMGMIFCLPAFMVARCAAAALVERRTAGVR